MNYNHDTEQDMDWSADQARRQKLMGTGLPDAPIRRVTAMLKESTMTPRAVRGMTTVGGMTGGLGQALSSCGDPTLGNAMSALAINGGHPAHVANVCQDLLALVSDRDRLALHAEFVELKGVERILEVVRGHDGEALLSALHILDKLSRTSARAIVAAGGIDVIVQICEKDGQAPRVIESALRTLHGLTFDTEAKLPLLRRGVDKLAESIVENRPSLSNTAVISTVPLAEHVQAADEAWQDVYSIATRLLQRMGGSSTGGLKRLPA